MTTLDTELTRFLTNATYGLWTHSSTRSQGLRYVLTDDPFELNKQRMLNTIWKLGYPGLVEKTLFPDYVEYEARAARAVACLLNAQWEGPILIPKCDAFPAGGSYRKCIIRLPKDLFQGIDGCFLKNIDCQITCIAPSLNEDLFFWHNLEWAYDRRETMKSWNGTLLETVKGRGMLVVKESFFSEDQMVRIVPAITSILLSAYEDYTGISRHPGSFQYVHTQIGRTRFRHNLDTLLCQSEDPAKRSLGKLILKVAEIEEAMKDPKKFSSPGCSMPEIERYAENGVATIAEVYKKTSGYRSLKEMEDLLNKTLPLIRPMDEYPVCELWNRCVKEKVRTKEQLAESLRSKCQAVIQKGLTLLSMHFIKEQTATSWYIV